MDEDDVAQMKAILREAFGDSSSESDGASSDDRRGSCSVFGDDTKIWEPVTEINGLLICRDFLTAGQQSSLLSSLEKDGYLGDDSRNQGGSSAPDIRFRASHTLSTGHSISLNSFAYLLLFWTLDYEPISRFLGLAMRFGDLPPWANELSYAIRENVHMHGFSSEPTGPTTIDDNSEEISLFPSELLCREPLFDQFIVNIYQPGEGICGHVDLLRFEDGIAIISLESSCVMHFSSVEAEADDSNKGCTPPRCTPPAKIPVLLTPGSLVLMWGDARYIWKHEINRKPGFQIWNGQEIDQKKRTSLTLRRLCRSE